MFGAIKRSLELNWGVKRKMYSSVFFFFSGTYCTVSFMRLLVCVSALWGGTLLPLMKAGKTGVDTKWQLPAVCAPGLSVWPPGPQHLLSDPWNQHSARLLWDRFSLHSPWFIALDWLGTHCVDPAGLELKVLLPYLVSRIVGTVGMSYTWL